MRSSLFGVYLAYIYYVTALSSDALDAARVYGCSEWQVFLRVALPLTRPVLALVFFFSFVADWNNFFLPYVVLPDSAQYPVAVGLNDLLVSAARPVLALAALIAAMPVVLVYLLAHRTIVRGCSAARHRIDPVELAHAVYSGFAGGLCGPCWDRTSDLGIKSPPS